MYRLGRRLKYKNKKIVFIYIISFFIIAIVVIVGYIIIKKIDKNSTIIKQSKGVTIEIANPNSAYVKYNEGIFSISLPKSWVQTKPVTSNYNIYSWQSVGSGTQVLDIYQDTIPVNFSVNRELAVQSEGNKIALVGSASDNCADFTKMSSVSATGTPAKWQGINFLCDLGNYERDVVGIGSSDGLNTVSLKGAINGKHQFFFTYTNNSVNPDFTIFYKALTSFYLK